MIISKYIGSARFSFRHVLPVLGIFLVSGIFSQAYAGLAGDPYYGDVEYAETGEMDVQVLHVTTNTDSKNPNAFTDIKVRLDKEGKMIGIRQISESGEVTDFSNELLKNGAVLRKDGDRRVLTLKGGVDPKSGGQLSLIYLTNGMFGSFGTFVMELVNDGSRWKLQTNNQAGRQEFNFMFVAGRWFGPILVGIKEIQVSKQDIR